MRKSTRRSSVALVPVQEPPPVRNISTRFSLTSFSKRVQQLTAEQRSAIVQTGFGNLLSVPNHSLNKVLLTELMEAWSCEKQAFVLGSGEMPMRLLDVALILGLPAAGKPIVLTEDEPFSDLEEVFGAIKGKRKVAMSTLEARLDSLGEVVSDDFVRTFLLYTIGTFLSSNDGKVDSRYLCYLGNLSEVCRYAWAAAVVEDLSQWLDKRKENNVKYVGGCLIFLQIWCYEHFDIARPNLIDHDLTFPRVCRWDNSKSHQRQRGTSFKDLHDDQVIWKLPPTSAELQIDIIKEALEVLDDNKKLQSAENCLTSTSTNVPSVDSDLQLSISNEVHREDENNFENQVVEDTPTRLSSWDDESGEQEIIHENLVIVEDTPQSLNNCDDEFRRQATNLEDLVIVEDTPSNLNLCENEVRRDQEGNLECLIVEDTPTSPSMDDKADREQEFIAEKLIVEDTPPELSFHDDDLRKKNAMLEGEKAELKQKLGQLMAENELLRRQVSSNTKLEEQSAELKKERDLLREENRTLRLSISTFADRMDRLVLEFETSAN